MTRLDLHLFVKNLKTKPFIDLGFVGKLDLANISKCMKLEPGTTPEWYINCGYSRERKYSRKRES